MFENQDYITDLLGLFLISCGYVILCCAGRITSLCQCKVDEDDVEELQGLQLSPYEAAFLAGGRRCAETTCLVSLVHRNILAARSSGWTYWLPGYLRKKPLVTVEHDGSLDSDMDAAMVEMVESYPDECMKHMGKALIERLDYDETLQPIKSSLEDMGLLRGWNPCPLCVMFTGFVSLLSGFILFFSSWSKSNFGDWCIMILILICMTCPIAFACFYCSSFIAYKKIPVAPIFWTYGEQNQRTNRGNVWLNLHKKEITQRMTNMPSHQQLSTTDIAFMHVFFGIIWQGKPHELVNKYMESDAYEWEDGGAGEINACVSDYGVNDGAYGDGADFSTYWHEMNKHSWSYEGDLSAGGGDGGGE